ncbi:hypothetical protein TWF481_009039 [Arthrobotrys musiformis]|uniref:Uncharacterized protein n=1 Tax=Arthrobotrys musiformis TaxID=47236 RepID=A0AAV9W2J6_9PEZI
MLPGRHVGAKALTWQTTRIQPSNQVRFLAASRPSLPKSIENNTRVNAILKVQSAVANTSSRLTLDSLTTDDQRRDYLWSRREQILKILPGREWKKVFAIARRLFEFNYLVRPPSDKEFRKRMLDNSGDLLVKLEQVPMWLSAEIKMLESLDREKAQAAERNSDITSSGTEKADNKSVSESVASTGVEEAPEDQKTQSTTESSLLGRVPVIPDAKLLEGALGGDAEDVSRYRNLMISPNLEPVTARPDPPVYSTTSAKEPVEQPTVKPATKATETPVEKPADKSAERFLEKKATESAKEAAPIPIIVPEYNRVMKSAGREEEATVEKLAQLLVPEDTASGASDSLQKLSRTLMAENVRPDLRPVFYSNQAAYALLAEATTILEEACFEFLKKRAPSVTTWPTFDCPEAQEYKRWVDLIVRLGKEHSKDGFKLPPKFTEGVGYGDIIRNSAAHRLPIHAPKIRELFRRSRMWVEALNVPEVTLKFDRLEQTAAEMQEELEEALNPVVGEINEILSRIQDRWDEIKRLEDKIIALQKSIRMEKVRIDLEEQNIHSSLRRAQAIRYEHGQKFERQKFQDHIQGKTAELVGSKTEAEELPEDWNDVCDESIVEESIEVDSDLATAEEGAEMPPVKTPRPETDAQLTRKERRKAAKAALAREEMARKAQLARGADKSQAERTNAGGPKLARDSQGGLVSFKRDSLPDIEEMSEELSRAARSEPWNAITKESDSKTEPSEDPGTKSTKVEDADVQKPKDKSVVEEVESKESTVSKSEQEERGAKWYNPLSWFK